jgi:hypothetical protein
MRKSKIIAAAGAVVAVAAISIAGPAGAAATAKNEQFTMITTNPGSGVVSVIATGGFTAGGTAVNIKHGQTFRFANGDFSIAIGKPGSKHQNLNLTNCLYTKSRSGTYTFRELVNYWADPPPCPRFWSCCSVGQPACPERGSAKLSRLAVQ